jgi:hypothetical protein
MLISELLILTGVKVRKALLQGAIRLSNISIERTTMKAAALPLP